MNRPTPDKPEHPQNLVTIIGIDPGPRHSTTSRLIVHDGWEFREQIEWENYDLLAYLGRYNEDRPVLPIRTLVAIEQVKSYGNPVGDEVFETVFWYGRFVQVCGFRYMMIPKATIAARLCRNPRAGKPVVSQALRDLYGKKGTKKVPGPLYGVEKHGWDALAVATVAAQMYMEEGGTIS